MMRFFGWMLTIAGLLGMWFGYASSGAASYSDTLNIGMLNDKSNAVIIGGFVWLAGVVLLAAAEVVSAIRPPEITEVAKPLFEHPDGAQG